MIIDAVIPLLLERGREVTSREIAEAAGIAEGTIFRAFGDKESLITAAVDSFMAARQAESTIPIDRDLPVQAKVHQLTELMRHRVRDVMRMAAIGGQRIGRTPNAEQADRLNRQIAELFAGNEHELRVTPQRIGTFVRAIAIASSIPTLDGSGEVGLDEYIDVLEYGVLTPTTTPKD